MAQLASGQLRKTMRGALAVPRAAEAAGMAALGQQVSACMSCERHFTIEAILDNIWLALTSFRRRQTGRYAECGGNCIC